LPRATGQVAGLSLQRAIGWGAVFGLQSAIYFGFLVVGLVFWRMGWFSGVCVQLAMAAARRKWLLALAKCRWSNCGVRLLDLVLPSDDLSFYS
jgi:hypothetical protein